MTWALRRQLIYLLIVILFFGSLGSWIVYKQLNIIPTCTDNKQNGDEKGIDCGGICTKVCTFQVDQISVLWSRSFRVVPGRYNAVAYLENQNKNTAIYKVNYKFRFADKDNVYIGKREGSTFVPPSGKFAVFEPAIDVGNSVPVYTTFEFTETPIWMQVSGQIVNQLKVLVSDVKLENEKTSPHLSAVVRNNSLFMIPQVSVIAILYDITGNAVSASRTFLDVLNPEGSADVNFTWPEPFIGEVITKEILPLYNISLVKLN